MAIEDTKAELVSRIWQSIAQSGVSVSNIPKDDLTRLVSAIADGVLVAVDDSFAAAGVPGMRASHVEAALEPATGEEILWEGRPFLSLTTYYQITSERVRIISGVLARDRDDIELVRIQDLDLSQGISERALGIGDIILTSADPSLPETVLRNVKHPEQVHEILRRAMLEARRRFRYSVQEEI